MYSLTNPLPNESTPPTLEGRGPRCGALRWGVPLVPIASEY
jgi:hypothetical protein